MRKNNKIRRTAEIHLRRGFLHFLVKMAHEMISVTMAGDFTVQGVYANPGLFIKKGENLCSLKNESTGNITKVKAPSSGKALRILVKKQSKVQQG